MKRKPKINKVLLIVPPFAALDRPALGVHILQGQLRAAGMTCDVLYSNALFARQIGFELYEKLAYSVPVHMLGERLFAAALEAEGHPGIVSGQADALRAQFRSGPLRETLQGDLIDIDNISLALDGLVAYRAELYQRLAATPADFFGLTNSFQQICSSEWHALLIRKVQASVTLAIGGANCHGAMALGIRAFTRYFDIVFSGESDHSLVRYCRGELEPADGIVRDLPIMNLNAESHLDYSAYYRQMQAVDYPGLDQAWLTYETSRGCWWGAKSHCTFCGLNPQAMTYRCKDPELALGELKSLYANHSSPNIFIVDNILPHSYIKDFLPRLQEEIPGCRIFYESKANLKPKDLDVFKAAGIVTFQPGIEALSSPLLKLMRKGVSGKSNLRLLVESKRRELRPQWNLLYGFPGERKAWYRKVLDILPRLHHLPPPTGATLVSLDRFSPLFEHYRSFEIDQVTPYSAYFDIFDDPQLVKNIAYYHEGQFSTELLADAATLQQLRDRTSAWVEAWKQRVPRLKFFRLSDEHCLVIDSRHSNAVLDWIPYSLARTCFDIDGLSTNDTVGDSKIAQLIERGYVLEWEGSFINLVEELVDDNQASDPAILVESHAQREERDMSTTSNCLPGGATAPSR